jgi:hypothetical protein
MDHVEPQAFQLHQSRPLFRGDGARRIEEMNVSELEVFMLRGRRLQARAVGDAVRQLAAKLRQRMSGAAREPSPHHPDCHSPA